MSRLSEDLIIAWMQLTAMMEKRTLVQGLSFNEALVCNLLSRGCTTASELCTQTRILKSQMNAILCSLERKGVISRSVSPSDRRKVEVHFKEGGYELYMQSHRHTLSMLDRLIESLGEENIRVLVPLLSQAAEKFNE